MLVNNSNFSNFRQLLITKKPNKEGRIIQRVFVDSNLIRRSNRFQEKAIFMNEVSLVLKFCEDVPIEFLNAIQ